MNEEDLEMFEQSFRCGISSQIGGCNCGRLFWDGYNTGCDWDEGQEENLKSNPNATRVPWGVEYVEIFGDIYCQDCDCWKEKAKKIIDWLRNYQSGIGEFFRREKRRLQNAADAVPIFSTRDQ